MHDNADYGKLADWSAERDRLERRRDEKRAFMKLAEQKHNEAGEEFLAASRAISVFLASHPQPEVDADAS